MKGRYKYGLSSVLEDRTLYPRYVHSTKSRSLGKDCRIARDIADILINMPINMPAQAFLQGSHAHGLCQTSISFPKHVLTNGEDTSQIPFLSSQFQYIYHMSQYDFHI